MESLNPKAAVKYGTVDGELVKLAVESARVGIWQIHVPTFTINWNDIFHEIVGVEKGSLKRYEDIRDTIHHDDMERYEDAVRHSMKTGEPYCIEHRVIRPADGREIWIRVTGEAVKGLNGNVEYMIGTGIDITHIKKAELRAERANEKLKLAVLTDHLTGLPNRAAVNHHLIQELEIASDPNKKVAVVQVDLDHFKEINDTYGHPAGDFMLVEIASRMQKWGGENKFVSRISGDDFLIIMTNFDHSASIESDLKVLLGEIAMPMNYEGITLQSTASIGISYYRQFGYEGYDLIINTDLALYESKQTGRGCICSFKPHMRETLDRRKLLEAELMTALNEGHVQPYFQPQINVSTKGICGVESLARWHHETRGLISPDEFLPVAESSGLMTRLGRHLMETAIKEAANWHTENIPFGRLGLNASAGELGNDDFVDWIFATAKRYGLPTHKLSVEILETVMIKDERLNLTDKLARLRRSGVHIELDDFGTGYASLQQVRTDEIDRLKIDQSFIKNIHNEHENAMIVQAIVNMANSLNIAVIAEGAETINELDTLLSLGCNLVQGYGVAMPMPAKAMRDWIKAFAPFSKTPNTKSNPNFDASPLNKLRVNG